MSNSPKNNFEAYLNNGLIILHEYNSEKMKIIINEKKELEINFN